MSERAASPARRTPQDAPAGAEREPLLTIGELLARLAPEFSDVTHSKVRFLEDRGLVSPQRTPSGYRKFTLADVERLRTVLRLQRDQFMPLRVIRDHLAALDADPGAQPPPGAARSVAGSVTGSEALEASTATAAGAASRAHDDDAGAASARHGAGAGARAGAAAGGAAGGDPAGGDQAGGEAGGGAVSADRRDPVARAEVLAEAGGSLALLEALEDHGLLPRESAGRYPRSALDLVRAAAVLGGHGIEPRHLRALRTAVGAEAALVEQVVSPLRRARPGERPERADERTEDAERVALELVTSLLSLHAAALGCALDEVPPPP